MKSYKKVVLEIGAGKKFLRARKAAKEHPNWLVIVEDKAAQERGWVLPNLFVSDSSFSPPAFVPIKAKVDEVWMHNIGVPVLNARSVYKWILRDDNNWLAEKHRIVIVDNSMTMMYYNCNPRFNGIIKNLRRLVSQHGYKVLLKLAPFQKIDSWDLLSMHHDRIIKIILEKA